MNDGDRFVTAMGQVTGKRLSYEELIGKTKDFESDSELPTQSEPVWEPF